MLKENDVDMKPSVKIIVLGGTITMTPQKSGGIAPSLTGEDLISAIPQLADIATVDVVTPFLVPGASLTFEQMSQVADLIKASAHENVDGVVIAQGTDTIDETAFLLDLVLQPGDPTLVVTGAMRGAAAPGADGHANIVSAITVAASDGAKGLGTLVVLNDEVHAACFVQKMDTGLPSAFMSPAIGPIGSVTEGKFRLRTKPAIAPLQTLDRLAPAPVAIIKTGLGDDGRLLDILPELGFRGAIIEATGAGHVPQQIVERLANLVERMPVVLATRVPAGPVFNASYGFPGSEMDLIGRGLIPAGLLPPHKARLLLACLVGSGFALDEINAHFKAFA